jgi:hypothetical protein
MEMIYYNQFVLNPEKFRIPQYNISPFNTEWLKTNYSITNALEFTDYNLLDQFFGKDHMFYDTGKAALYAALFQYSLKDQDEVYIITSSGNKYVSSCVTNEIERICKWSRQLTNRTKLILVVHEFGIVYKGMDDLMILGLPIIEDLAMSLFSTDTDNRTGNYGDFSIYSLPKFLPIQFGGVLKNNHNMPLKIPSTNDHINKGSLAKLASHYLKDSEAIKDKRKSNYDFFLSEMELIGLYPRFHYLSGETTLLLRIN